MVKRGAWLRMPGLTLVILHEVQQRGPQQLLLKADLLRVPVDGGKDLTQIGAAEDLAGFVPPAGPHARHLLNVEAYVLSE